ncbi:VCBS repeat-containing protein [bacterium]|nr:VCBS repeat-containing protein [bacterium]
MGKVVMYVYLICAVFQQMMVLSQDVPRFKAGNRLKFSNGADLTPGSTNYTASPCVVDWNNDGKQDLLVGYFYHGSVYLYLNTGTVGNPVFEDGNYQLVQAGGAAVQVGYS